jgi:hypothetical protein
MTRTIDQLVIQEVHCSVSHLISELGQVADHLEQSEEFYQLHYKPIGDDEYIECASQNGCEITAKGDDFIISKVDGHEQDDGDEFHGDEFHGDVFDSEGDAAKAFCEYYSLDVQEYAGEVFEHWIISDWLARKLEAKDECVVRDFMGLTIWGRTCTGQGIACDWVIQEIYNELMES